MTNNETVDEAIKAQNEAREYFEKEIKPLLKQFVNKYDNMAAKENAAYAFQDDCYMENIVYS